MQLDREPMSIDGAEHLSLWGHGGIVLAICLLAALISFPTGW